MKIPLKDNQQVLQPVNISAPQGFVNVPQGALGEGMAKLSLKAANDLDRAKKEFADWQIRQAEIAQDGILNELRQDYLNQLNTALTSTDIDEKTNKPKGLLARQGANAAGITVEYDSLYGGLKNQIMGKSGQLSPRAQRRLADYMDKDNYAKRLEVAGYEAKQKLAFEENSFKTNLASRLQQAPMMNNKDVLRINIEDAYEDIERYYHLHGMPKEAADLAKKEFAGQMTAINVANALDNNNLKAAKSLFAAFENDMDVRTAAKLKDALKTKQNEENIQQLWQTAQKFKNPVSGEVPLTLLADLVDKQDNLSFFEKQDYLRKLEALNADAKRAAIEERAENDENFYGSLYELIKNGGSETEALKLADDFAAGNYDRIVKERFVRQSFGGEKQEDIHKYIELRDGIDDGNTTRQMLDNAFENGLINGASYKSLTKELNTKQTAQGKVKGLSDTEKKQINALIEAKFEDKGFNKKQKEQFEYSFYKTVEERGLNKDFSGQKNLVEELLLPAEKKTVFESVFDKDEQEQSFNAQAEIYLTEKKGLSRADSKKIADWAIASTPKDKAATMKWLRELETIYPNIFTPGTLEGDALAWLYNSGEELTEQNLTSAIIQYAENMNNRPYEKGFHDSYNGEYSRSKMLGNLYPDMDKTVKKAKEHFVLPRKEKKREEAKTAQTDFEKTDIWRKRKTVGTK